MRIGYGILVIYNHPIEKSSSYATFKDQLSVIVADNSTNEEIRKRNQKQVEKDGNVYLDMKGNQGLSKAYNQPPSSSPRPRRTPRIAWLPIRGLPRNNFTITTLCPPPFGGGLFEKREKVKLWDWRTGIGTGKPIRKRKRNTARIFPEIPAGQNPTIKPAKRPA